VPFLLKALPAEHWPPLRGAKWHGCLFPTLRAGSPRLDLGVALSRCRSQYRDALTLAGLAALGFVLELLVVEKELFTGGKDEIRTAIYALEYFVLELH